MWWWYDCYTHTSNVRLSRSWGSWASYFFSILILLEILTLPLHHHFLLASQPPYLPPPTVSHTHTRTHAGRHTHKYTHAHAALSFARSLSLSSHLSHIYTQLTDRNVCGRGITDLVQTGKTWGEKIDGGMRVWKRETEWERCEGWQVSVNAALYVRVCGMERVLVSVSGVVCVSRHAST